MLKLINGPVEILRHEEHSHGFPICDKSGFLVGSGETYRHALEISEAVSNYNELLLLLHQSKTIIGKGSNKSRQFQLKVGRFLDTHMAVSA